MAIIGIERMTGPELFNELRRGGRFVTYEYCVSLIFVTMKRSSDIYFIRAGESAAIRGLRFTFLSLLFGLWGFPFGPIFTVWVIITNLLGGHDVTSKVVAGLQSMGRYRPEEAGTPHGVTKDRNAGAWPYLPGYTIRIDQPPEQGK